MKIKNAKADGQQGNVTAKPRAVLSIGVPSVGTRVPESGEEHPPSPPVSPRVELESDRSGASTKDGFSSRALRMWRSGPIAFSSSSESDDAREPSESDHPSEAMLRPTSTMGARPRNLEEAEIYIDEKTLPATDRPIERQRVDPTKTQIIDVLKLPDVERGKLAVGLNRITAEVFLGPSLLGIGQFTNDRHADQVGLQIYHNQAGQAVGYHVCKVNTVHVEGHGKISVMRSRAGIKAEYRRGNKVMEFVLAEVLRYKRAHPNADLRYFTLVIHPTSYAVMGKGVPDLLQPSPDRPMDEKTRALMNALADAKDYEVVDPKKPMVMKASYGTTTRQSEGDARTFRGSDNRFVRYFIEQTDMQEGVGLAVTVPCNFVDIVPFLAKRVGAALLRSVNLGGRIM